MTGTAIIIANDRHDGEQFAERALGLRGSGFLVVTRHSTQRTVMGRKVSTIHRTGHPDAWLAPEVRQLLDFRLRYEGSSVTEREEMGRYRERTWQQQAGVRR